MEIFWWWALIPMNLHERERGRIAQNLSQNERLAMLAHVRSVGILKEASRDVGALIKCVQPDVLITSESTKDFTKKEATAYKSWCGKVVVLPPRAATSTTARVRLLTIDGAEELAKEIVIEIPRLVENALKKFHR